MSEECSRVVDVKDFETSLRETDPRDYLKVSTFQKHAREIDSNIDNPWERYPDGIVWIKKAEHELMMSSGIDFDGSCRNILLLSRSPNGEVNSGYLDNLTTQTANFIESTIRIVSRRFPAEKRPIFIKELLENYPKFSNMDHNDIAFKVTLLALDLLPDDPDMKPLEKIIELSASNDGTVPDKWQNSSVQRLMQIVSRKMSRNEFDKKLSQLTKDIEHGYIDHIYGKYFDSIFSYGLDWVVSSRMDIQESDMDLDNKDTGRKSTFPIKDLVKKDIRTVADLQNVLSDEIVKKEPDWDNTKGSDRKVEFVDVVKIVGGNNITDWSEPDFGIKHVKWMVDNFMNGGIDISVNDTPIDLKEINGEYYVSGDGRHRTAALKALNVSFIPAVVTHCIEV